MSQFSDLLRRTREGNGITLSELSRQCECPRQTLSNYERGASLPRRALLKRISEWYGIPLDRLEGTYTASGATVITGAYAKKPFEYSLQTLGEGDHFVTVTQKSIVAEDRDVASFIARMIGQGTYFTFVAHLPSIGQADETWYSNHREAASTLVLALEVAGIPASTPLLSYVLIGKPSSRDYAFLRAYGALLFACRTEQSKHEPISAWTQLPTVDGERAFVPFDDNLVGQLQHWLLLDCGVALPRGIAKPGHRNSHLRDLRVLSAEALLKA